MNLNIRIAEASDVPALAELYQTTVLEIAPQKYSPEQTQMWASFAVDTAIFQEFILKATTFIATDETEIVGFAGIAENGRVTATYVRKDRIRQGIGTILMEEIIKYAYNQKMPHLYAEASEFSLGLFQKFGFYIYDTEIVSRHGVEFQRYLVELIWH
ncbi:GNAT family N-acetyltransferase [Okeanomitos corallinicola TIOX110]|uniref:GNAT family N-acetyltransferase n=1 Tax=Okeanomitos corallinicola TIOX110 TaxID=3133117 RepID=A0ABZ2UWC0_9CYAN